MKPQSSAERLRERAQALRSSLPHQPATPDPMRTLRTRSAGADAVDRHRSLELELETLQTDLARRSASYERREHGFLNTIQQLSEEISSNQRANPEQRTKSSMDELKRAHTEIMDNLDLVDSRTTAILQDQERDLLRAFRARLFDMQTELDREKAKRDDSAAAWIQRSRHLEAELDWAKEMADRLQHVNHELSKENQELKDKFKVGEGDRQFLIQQLVAVKKDNSRLTKAIERIDSEQVELNEAKSKYRPFTSSTPTARGLTNLPSVDKYEENKNKHLNEIKRLKRLLENQQRNLRQVRQQYAAELYGRTELQRFMKQCLLDIRAAIDAKRGVPAYARPKTPAAPLGRGLARFASGDTGQISDKPLSMLQSQERVVTMLFQKAFPAQGPRAKVDAVPSGAAPGAPGAMAPPPSRSGRLAELATRDVSDEELREIFTNREQAAEGKAP